MSDRHHEQLPATARLANKAQPCEVAQVSPGISARWRLLPLAVAGSLLVSGQSVPRTKAPAPIDTHEVMTDWINPAAISIWDVVARAKSQTDGLDSSMMDRAAWSKIRQAAQALELHSNRMAHARILRVGNHTDEQVGFADRAEIQARIDATPEWFRAMSQRMADEAGELSRAAAARDPRATSDLAERMSDHCQSCHTRYWAKPAA